jgi:6-phosphogluconolactonase
MLSIFPDLETLSQAAAGLVVKRCKLAVEAQARFSIVLSGGSTPRRTYELLGTAPYRDQIAWQSVHVFWGDERCVPSSDPRSNAKMAYDVLLDKVPIPQLQIRPVRCSEDPSRAAKDYEDVLRTFFHDQPPRFDLVLLGLGGDGHTASLFPGTPALKEDERWVAEVFTPGQDFQRITLTVPIINAAAAVAFIVSGSEKAQALHQVREGDVDPEHFPAQLISPVNGQLIWLVDEKAASHIESDQERV